MEVLRSQLSKNFGFIRKRPEINLTQILLPPSAISRNKKDSMWGMTRTTWDFQFGQVLQGSEFERTVNCQYHESGRIRPLEQLPTLILQIQHGTDNIITVSGLRVQLLPSKI